MIQSYNNEDSQLPLLKKTLFLVLGCENPKLVAQLESICATITNHNTITQINQIYKFLSYTTDG